VNHPEKEAEEAFSPVVGGFHVSNNVTCLLESVGDLEGGNTLSERSTFLISIQTIF
jgi:hypothetical protein